MAVAVVPKFCAPAEQPHSGRVGGPAYLVAHPDGLCRRPNPDREVEQGLRSLGETEQAAAAAMLSQEGVKADRRDG